ncbi:NAD(P)H-dependent oxidoreductase [Saprospira sp. CCB-QB6]|uniref:NAD(P)H-dependent oxidoreductase n=1 Tax=Saprospira sp. CCB-QB6 TaxID=3023936 RepID=UPI00234BDA73|nr:NAD(P)H-dependent oxidoreductase [Saprospira sp. CCB-QB6]WCL81499.1 NAD(P)H-dependent oxidoreductase [Saprospira sp. CCB-QB6]
MKKQHIFVINAGFPFGHSPGQFNQSLLALDLDFFGPKEGYELQYTKLSEEYDLEEEVEKFLWADTIIYHMPIWWFHMPFRFKEYIDRVFTQGHGRIYASDGRSSKNPKINYGTGGLLDGRNYLVTSSWNAPKEAFEWEGEFFQQKSVDEGVLFPFHRMNAFVGLEFKDSLHFHDIEKNARAADEFARYQAFLTKNFS